MTLEYLSGFGNHFATEARPGALPVGQNSPQEPPIGLYAEQLTGSAFTAPRHANLRSWLYRIRPSVGHDDFKLLKQPLLKGAPYDDSPTPPTQLRWDPLPYPEKPTDFIQGLITMSGNAGAAIHHYICNTNMGDTYFYNADGELLIVPQEGSLTFKTEMGILTVTPGDIIVMPRGIKFTVDLDDDKARGYICENFSAPFGLPGLGPIGANGLANPRDFQFPVAWFEEKETPCRLIAKFNGNLWETTQGHSPLNVVGWHGNYAPYKYDLSLFNTINTVSYDHPDPSIFTVLTSQTDTPGVANVDFVIFPERWMVAEHTFRAPYYHRNIMSEYMGLIYGVYDAKEAGFVPGGASLHNCMSSHGPDAAACDKSINTPLKPDYYKGTLAFMFESHKIWEPTNFALTTKSRQTNYLKCWDNIPKRYK